MSTRATKKYVGTCVSLPGDQIAEMVDRSRQVSRRTFLRHVEREELRKIEARLGYAPARSQGLTMEGDQAVRYYLSVYHGKPCAYIDWSAIEHVFAEKGNQ